MVAVQIEQWLDVVGVGRGRVGEWSLFAATSPQNRSASPPPSSPHPASRSPTITARSTTADTCASVAGADRFGRPRRHCRMAGVGIGGGRAVRPAMHRSDALCDTSPVRSVADRAPAPLRGRGARSDPSVDVRRGAPRRFTEVAMYAIDPISHAVRCRGVPRSTSKSRSARACRVSAWSGDPTRRPARHAIGRVPR